MTQTDRRLSRISLGVARWVAIVVMLIGTLIPLLWVLVTAFKPNSEVLEKPATILPKRWTLENLAGLSADGTFSYLSNSLIATLGSTLVVLLIATPAAYAIARHRFPLRGERAVELTFLAARFIPIFMIIVPTFLIYRDLQLLNTVWVLVLAYTAMNLPLAIWIILPAAQQLPEELLEAARVDGAGIWKTFTKVSLPLLRPAIATSATLCMVFAWNEFFAALVFTQSDSATLPVLLSGFFNERGIEFGRLAANALVAIVPVVALGMLAQRHLVAGLTAGALK